MEGLLTAAATRGGANARLLHAPPAGGVCGVMAGERRVTSNLLVMRILCVVVYGLAPPAGGLWRGVGAAKGL